MAGGDRSLAGPLSSVAYDRGRQNTSDLKDNRWAQVAILALLYVATSRLGHLLAIPPGLATPVWLPSGITVAALILFGTRLWPGVFIGAFVTSAMRIGDLRSLDTLLFTSAIGILIAVAVTTEPLLTAHLQSRLRVDGPFLSRTRNVSVLLLIAAPISCALTAALAGMTMAFTGLIEWNSFGETWTTWTIGDLAGICFITPALLTWPERPWRKLSSSDRAVAAVSIFCLAFACALTFLDAPPLDAQPPLHFLPIPPLVFIAYRFDNRFAVLVGPALAAAAILAAANGLGPFRGGASNESLLALQLYVLVGVLTALFTRALANERNVAEQAAQRLRTDLAHISRVTMMGEIAAGMAHEYHQPLTSIANYAAASAIKLRRHGAAYEEVRDSLEQITEETQRAAEIVDRLKDFLQKREPSRTPCDPNDLVAEAVRLTEMAHSFPRVSIRYEPNPSLRRVNVDATQITQVLLNLILNSCEAIESSGLEHGSIRITSRITSAGRVQIDVEDNGPGMDRVSAQKCFDQFYSTKEHGLGVGLGISRTLAEAHGGRLDLVSSDERGTTFRLELPLPGSSPVPR